MHPVYISSRFYNLYLASIHFVALFSLHFQAHVTHPELQTTFYLPIVGVKKNPSSSLYTSLGVITKGTIIEVRFYVSSREILLSVKRDFKSYGTSMHLQVNISELGMVTQGGKVVWAKYAQVTNNPENDGCINAVLLL